MTISEKQVIDEWCKARIFSILAPYLPVELREQLLTRVRRFRNVPARVQGLIGISNAFPEQLAGEIHDEAYTIAQSIENYWLRSRALIGLARRMPKDKTHVLAEALSTVERIHSSFHRAQALLGMAGLLTSDFADQAVALARSIKDASARAACLAFLACYLEVDERLGVLKDIPSIADDLVRPYALIALAEHLPAQSMDDALECARSFSDPEGRARALAGLASSFPNEKRTIENEALASARLIANPYIRTGLIGNLILTLPEGERSELIQEEIDAARETSDALYCALTLMELAQCHSEADRPAVVQEAVQYARSIDGKALHVEVLAWLLNELSEIDRSDMVLEILAEME